MESMGIAETIIEVIDRDLKPVILDEVTNKIKHQYLSAKKDKEMLDWKPRYTLEAGLRRTIEWYKKFLLKRWISGEGYFSWY